MFTKVVKVIPVLSSKIFYIIPASSKIETISQPTKKIPRRLSCRVCKSEFTCISNRRRHEIHKHNFSPKQELVYNYACRVCVKKFTNSMSRRRHERNKHNFNPDLKQELICSQCFEVFNSRKAIMSHISSNHSDIILKKETKQFKTMEEFESWKKSVEKDTACSFCTSRKSNYKDFTIKDYLCHQGGTFISKSLGKRRLKSSGSFKSGYFCPANMRVKIDSGVNVTFLSTHIGHLFNVGNTPSSVSEQNELTVLKEIEQNEFAVLKEIEQNEFAVLKEIIVPNSSVTDEIAEAASPTKRKLNPDCEIEVVSQPTKKIPRRLSCRVCNSQFTCISNRRRHEIHKHNFYPKQELVYKYSCRVCVSKFTNSMSRRRHEKNKHNFNPDSKQELTCSQCLQVFNNKKAIMSHISSSHSDTILKEETKQFKTMEEFENWKTSVEKDTACSFCTRRTHHFKDYIIKDYLCHQGGKLISKSLGIRRLKSSGSYKSGFFCPANMKVKIDTEINVTFLSTHIGHL